MAALLLIGAGPASQPTTKPAKPFDWTKAVKSIPKNMLPPEGKGWASGELASACDWIAQQLKDQVVTLSTVQFDYIGGKDRMAKGESDVFRSASVRWTLAVVECRLSADGDKAASKLRDSERVRVTGRVTDVSSTVIASGSDGSVLLTIWMDDATVK